MNNPECYDPDCPFCRIVRGEQEAAIVYEDDISLAFLDRRPVFHGHCLLIPRLHIETLPDLPPGLLQPYLTNVQRLCRAMERGLGAEGSLVLANNRVSQSVPHLHMHIIPRRKGDGLRGFLWPRLQYESEEQMTAIRDALRRAIAQV